MAYEDMADERDWEQEQEQEQDGRTSGRMLWVSVLVLCLESVAVWIGTETWSDTQPSYGSGYDVMAPLFLPVLTVVWLFGTALVSLALVLPAVGLSEALEDRFGGRTWRWLALVAIVPAALLVPLLGAWWWWPVGWAGLTVAALAARRARRGSFVTVLLWGTAAVLGVGMAGGVAGHTGLIPTYAPPRLSGKALVGTWTDGSGGRLTFTADGRVTVEGVVREVVDEYDNVLTAECTGEGGWAHRVADGSGRQEVELSVDGCFWPAWEVGGTDAVPALYQLFGDPDAPRLYELRKAPPATR
ncbi:hypothetical protein AB4225_02700 [Streptomyces sp. 2RAF24]|uniref:hypothetical protein n=1 Tax=Streptomyces sp. 2RAF24 TaxID=3232997 RepID=UPI003F98B78E